MMNYLNNNYNEMIERANNGQLTENDLNEILLVFNQKLKECDSSIKSVKETAKAALEGVEEIKKEYTLLPAETDEISTAVRKKGVEILGGKNSAAYKNVALRKTVYKDIYGVIKRQYGLTDERGRQLSYKKLQRKYFKGALRVVKEYEPPIILANEIDDENDLYD